MDDNTNNARQQVIDSLKDALNVLVTVNTNPSVDQLSAAIGLTLLLNKLGKHGTAVFSGEVPSTLEFLEPQKTLETNTDSLRDFIISLDKSKADKLRYKVEEKVVRIFITPYRTPLSQDDLEFSQGDFNVDVVMALGVDAQEELDQAVLAQARILHDAKIIGISNKAETKVGSINWYDNTASSLCEMLLLLGDSLKSEFLDAQMATAFLTGIVAETDRFSNEKTTPQTMTVAGRLMTAGANQHLIATRLEMPEPEPQAPEPPEDTPPPANDDKQESAPEPGASEESDAPGTPEDQDEQQEEPAAKDGLLQVNDEEEEPVPNDPEAEEAPEEEKKKDTIRIDKKGKVKPVDEAAAAETADQPEEQDEAAAEQAAAGQADPEQAGPAADAEAAQDEGLTLPPVDGGGSFPSQDSPPEPPAIADDHNALGAQQQDAGYVSVDPSPADPPQVTPPELASARDAVHEAIVVSPDTAPLEPLQALNSQPVDLNAGADDPSLTDAKAPANLITPEPQPNQGTPPPFTVPTIAPAAPPAQDAAGDDTPSVPPVPPLNRSGRPTHEKVIAPPPSPPPIMPQADVDGQMPSGSNPFTLPPAQ